MMSLKSDISKSEAQIGASLLEKFIEALSEYSSTDKAPKLEGRNMFVVVSPK